LVDDLIEVKYFKTIWPKNPRDQATEALENFIFGIIYNKIYKVTEDNKGFAQQLRDRLNVLKGLINFEMLDVPLSMRDHSLFIFAIKGTISPVIVDILEFEKISKFKSPRLKIEAFQNCANHLIGIKIFFYLIV
jgi:hypothetical protein